MFDFVKKYGVLLVTLVAVVALGLVMFSMFDLNTEQDEAFYLELTVVILIQVIMIALWLPEGKTKGRKDANFVKDATLLNKRLEEVSKDYDNLDKFCRYATEQNRLYVFKRRLLRLGIAYEIYIEQKDNPDWDITPRQRRGIKRAERAHIHVREIKAMSLTTNAIIDNVFDVRNKRPTEERIDVAVKLLSSVVTALVGAMLIISGKNVDYSTVTKFLYYLFVTCSTIFFAMRTGFNLIAGAEHDYVIRNIDFLSRFEAWKKSL